MLVVYIFPLTLANVCFFALALKATRSGARLLLQLILCGSSKFAAVNMDADDLCANYVRGCVAEVRTVEEAKIGA